MKAIDLLNDVDARHVLLRGGSRSGKTFVICRNIIVRALMANNSTHAILREHFNHLKHTIIFDTMPTVLRVCFPEIRVALSKTDWYHEFPNKARILYGGLDDKERTDKILGQEHSTIYLNECPMISYSSRNKAMTRLAQRKGLRLKMYYDCNPPPQGHWVHSLFIKKIDPSTRLPLAHPEHYREMQINPIDNKNNLSEDYFQMLESLPERDRIRFLYGEFASQLSGALWNTDMLRIDTAAESEKQLNKLRAKMRRVVIAIDPSGCSGPEDERSDEIGMIVAGVDRNNAGYILEDASGHYSPEEWSRTAISLYDKWEADTIIGEVNYGGDMVRAVVQATRKSVPFKKITASRGKHIRAEPISSMYEKGQVIHNGSMVDLENQYMSFTTSGYQGDRSPDRADAAIFALSELMIEGSSYDQSMSWV